MTLAPAVLALMLGLWGTSRLSFWRDEGVTASVVRRTVPEIFHFLGNLDAVHGTYYLLLHPLAAVFGTSELVLRLPSALATAAAAAGVTALGHRLLSPQTGLAAGFIYAVAPYASHFALEARPYAMATALTVLATLLFVRTAEQDGKGRYALYGCVLVVLGMIHLFALLVLPAHLATLLLQRRWTHVRWWFVTVSIAIAVLSPLIAVSASQRAQVGWLTRPGLDDVAALVLVFAGSWPLALLMGAVVATGSVLARREQAQASMLLPLVVPWLVLPPAALLLLSQVHPLYSARYVSMSLPALALLVAAGMTRFPPSIRLVSLLTVAVLAVPAHVSQRQPDRRPDHLREAATILSRHASPGDVIVYLPTNRRAVAGAYPDGFRQLRDVTMLVSPAQAGNLGGVEVDPGEIRRRLKEKSVARAWLLEGEEPWRGPTLDMLNRAKVETLEQEFHQIRRWQVRSLTLTLYTR
ncbi:hypothetical protein GCM10010466_64910 [Planomonospora alba]|uniref:Glycosyltransferase RgtA/B/C/D-like domain-containing protein n=1 Tax=Planomonospora alba TaxID=161354 RepID=A0ABP6P2C6_9ACTN